MAEYSNVTLRDNSDFRGINLFLKGHLLHRILGFYEHRASCKLEKYPFSEEKKIIKSDSYSNDTSLFS